MQHGAAVAALVAWAAENVSSDRPLQVARMTVDFMRPVPVAPLQIRTDMIREGRKIQICEIRLIASGVEVVRASVVKRRAFCMERAPCLGIEPPDMTLEDAPEVSRLSSGASPFLQGLSMRLARGQSGRLGPKAIWYRADRVIIKDQPISPLMRAAVAADLCNGTSALLDARAWSFMSSDVSVNLLRMPVGEWILLDAQSWIGPDGSGLAFARLADVEGYFGRAIQSLLIQRRAET